MEYPKVRRDEAIVDEIHGHKICDPYRYLEDPDTDETKEFVANQNNITLPFIDQCPAKESIKTQLTALWNYPKYSCPFKESKRYFYFMNTGLQNQSVMYVLDDLEGEPKVFLDPNTLSDDGTVAISYSAFSENGEIFAYGLSRSGSDWVSIHFKNVSTGEEYDEVLEKVKFSHISWTHDDRGIFYSRYLEHKGKADGSETTSNENQKLFYHHVGTPQSEDILVAEFPEHPKWTISAKVTNCGDYLIVCPAKECRDNLVYCAPVPDNIKGKISLQCIVGEFEADYEYITNEGSVAVFRTNKDAPNYKLVRIDLSDPGVEKWTTLLPEHQKDVLDWAACVNKNILVVCYISDVKSILKTYSLVTGEYIMSLPVDIGTISGYSGKKKHSELFYQFTSFLSPGIIYHLDLTHEPWKPKIFHEIKIGGFDPSLYEMKQVFYNSKDGIQIPMFLVYSKSTPQDGQTPTLLYGYGGFNVSLQPYFSISRIYFIQRLNGLVAIPNLRGGGEYGENWHNAGRLLNKQNTFNDFIAAAEYLIQEKYTRSSRIVIQGHSNGGLLIGACLNQRPDLFGAAIAHVGVMDLLRYHKFTIGYAWSSDYGDPEEEKHFNNLLNFSPLHNVRIPADGRQYPATLLVTADHDDRVVPLHSFKLISELQHRLGGHSAQTNPLLILIDTKAGHGGGKPTTKLIEEVTQVYSFVMIVLGLE